MNLWRRIMAVVFRRTFARRAIPLAPGRIYQCSYRSGRPGYIIHDPKPTIFVLSSDVYYTTGLNFHYLGAFTWTLTNWIIAARERNLPINGLIIYRTLKMTYPIIPKLAFRKYFTSNLRAVLVSSGLSNMPEPNAVESIAEPWARRINQTLQERIAVREKVETREEAERIEDSARITTYNLQPGAPFKQRIAYRPENE